MGTSGGLMDEHFVPIVDFENYEVSNYGRVVNTVSGRDIAIMHESNGTCIVKLYKRGRKVVQLKRLVAQAFFTDYKPWSPVYLISENKDDCTVRNITLTEPARYRERRLEKAAGEGKAVRIVELNETFDNLHSAARRIGGSAAVISKILYGQGKTHKGYTFKHVETHNQ